MNPNSEKQEDIQNEKKPAENAMNKRSNSDSTSSTPNPDKRLAQSSVWSDSPVKEPVYTTKKYYFNVKMPFLPILFVLLVAAAILLYYFWGEGAGDGLGINTNAETQTPAQKEEEKKEEPLPEVVPDVPMVKQVLSLDELARAGFPASQMPQTLLVRFTGESFTVQIECDGFKTEQIKAFDQTGFWESFAHSLEKVRTGGFLKPVPENSSSNNELVKPIIQSILVIDAQTQGIKDSTGKIIGEYFSDVNVNYYDTKE